MPAALANSHHWRQRAWLFRGAGMGVLFPTLFGIQLSGLGNMESSLSVPRLATLALLSAAIVYLVERLAHCGYRRLEAVVGLSRVLADPDRGVALAGALDTGVRLSDADLGVLFVMNEAGQLSPEAFHAIDPAWDEEIDLDPTTFCGRAVGESGPVVFQPSADRTMPVGYLPVAASKVVAAVPLVVEGELQGLMLLGYRNLRRLLPAEIESLRLIGGQLAVALHYRKLLHRLEREARTDPLTGVGSRRVFEEQYPREVARALRTKRPLSLAVIDMDGFKQINDVHGHQVGDRVLALVGDLLRSCRKGDLVVRYGGDEFMVLMPDTTAQAARGLMVRLEARLQAINSQRLFPFPVSFSVGVAEIREPGADLLATADAEMYRIKHAHRLVEEAHDSRRSLPHWTGVRESVAVLN